MPARYSRLMFDFVFYWFSFFHQMFRKLVQESGVKGQTFMSNWHNQCVQIKLLESLTFTTSCAHNVKTQLENLVLQNFNLLHWRVVILCVAIEKFHYYILASMIKNFKEIQWNISQLFSSWIKHLIDVLVKRIPVAILAEAKP